MTSDVWNSGILGVKKNIVSGTNWVVFLGIKVGRGPHFFLKQLSTRGRRPDEHQQLAAHFSILLSIYMCAYACMCTHFQRTALQILIRPPGALEKDVVQHTRHARSAIHPVPRQHQHRVSRRATTGRRRLRDQGYGCGSVPQRLARMAGA